MTYIIKDFPMLSSKDVVNYLKANPDKVEAQLDRFREELSFIKAVNPIILAFGKQTFEILNRGLKKNEYSSLILLTYYGHQISKENYRSDIHKKLEIFLSVP